MLQIVQTAGNRRSQGDPGRRAAMEETVTQKSTRITVDLGSEQLVKSVKIAAVEQGRTVRDIVIEALTLWLEPGHNSKGQDYQTMIDTLNKYRGVGSQ